MAQVFNFFKIEKLFIFEISSAIATRRYNTTLSKVIDCHALLKTKTMKVRPAVPWYIDEIKASKRLRRKAERTWRRTRSINQSINQSTLFKHGKWLSKLVFRHAV